MGHFVLIFYYDAIPSLFSDMKLFLIYTAVKKEIPKFLKKPDNVECVEFDEATFISMISGKPEPIVEW